MFRLDHLDLTEGLLLQLVVGGAPDVRVLYTGGGNGRFDLPFRYDLYSKFSAFDAY